MEKQLDDLGLDYRIVAAVDGSLLSQQEIDDIYDPEKTLALRGRPLTQGEIGCALSHIKLYKEILENNIDAMLILEDDIYIDSRIFSVLENTGLYPEGWDIIFAGYRARRTFMHLVDPPVHFLKDELTLNKAAGLQGVRETNGYLISHSGAVKLLELTKGLHKPIDLYTGNYSNLNIYLVKPKLIQHLQDSFASTIDGDRHISHHQMQSETEKKIWVGKFPWLSKFPKAVEKLSDLRIVYGTRKIKASISDRVLVKLYAVRYALIVKIRK